MTNDFEEINAILASMAHADVVEPIECDEDEYDHAVALFEGMAEYTEQKTPVATIQQHGYEGSLQANAVGVLQNEGVVVVCVVAKS